MGEVVRFVPKAELERILLVREARAIYESVFPSAIPVNEQRHRASASRAIGDANIHRGDEPNV
jgi:tRNA threonylcarbamoyladenosine modification (KEOPS) complex  Pcc1 subunit